MTTHVARRLGFVAPSAADHSLLGFLRPGPDSPPFADTTNFTDRLVTKAWGEEYELFRNRAVALWCLTFNGKGGMSFHCHRRAATAILVVAGTARVSTLGDEYELDAGDGLLVPNGVFHRISAPTESVVAELLDPPLREDVVRATKPAACVVRAETYLGSGTIRATGPTAKGWRVPRDESGCVLNSQCGVAGLVSCAYGDREYLEEMLADGAKLLGAFGVSDGGADRLHLDLPTGLDCGAEFVAFFNPAAAC